MPEKIRLLYVEDDTDLREAIAEELEFLGVQVTPVKNGLEALSALDSNSFDAVVTDMNMPEMGGLKLRQLATDEKVKIQPKVWVLLTGNSSYSTQDLKSLGFTEVFIKPFRVSDLVRFCREQIPDRV